MDPKRVKGKIVLCRFQDDFGGGGTEAALVPAGAAGQILARDAGDEDFYSDVVNEPSILPTILVSDKQKRGIVSYINSTGCALPPMNSAAPLSFTNVHCGARK